MDVRKEGHSFIGPMQGFSSEHERAVKDLALAEIRMALTEPGTMGRSLVLSYIESLGSFSLVGGSREVYVGEETLEAGLTWAIGPDQAKEMIVLARSGQVAELIPQEKHAWLGSELVR